MKPYGPRGYFVLTMCIMVAAASVSVFTAGNDTSVSSDAPQQSLSANFVPSAQSIPGTSILDTINKLNIPTQYVYLPNVLAQNLPDTGVTGLYDRSPAPMGIADYGLLQPTGITIPYTYNTTSFLGSVMFEDLSALYLMNNDPHSVAVQLSAVLTDVTVHGNNDNVFWIKNVFLYNPVTGQGQLIANVWDFSTPSLSFPSDSILPGNGTLVQGLFYYYAGPLITMAGEDTLGLTVNTIMADGNDGVTFGYAIGDKEGIGTVPQVIYDKVVFNSYETGSGKQAGNAVFEVNGFKKTPSGFLYDAEMVLTGPGAGSTTSIHSANGQMTLRSFSSNDATYVKLPGAYNYGSNTGETIQGLSVWWSSQMKPMAHLSTGPSLLVPLWGSQISHSGAVNIQGTIDPPNSFVFVSTGTSFDNGTAAWAPVNNNGTYKFSLPGRISYSVMVLLSDFNPVYFHTIAEIGGEEGDEGVGQSHGGGGGGEGGDTTVAWYNVSLSANPAEGVTTPLYAVGNDQVKYLTVGSSANGTYVGNGTEDNPYVIENNQKVNLNPLFSVTNNFLYPTFSGIMVTNSSVHISIEQPISSHVKYGYGTYYTMNLFNLPSVNSLNAVFYRTSNITLYNAKQISGWFPSTMARVPAANVIFYDSANFLIASNNFMGMGSSLLIYNGNGMEGGGTVWGNHFVDDLVLQSAYAKEMKGSSNPIALSVFSSGNLIYNNYFATGSSVSSPGHSMYSSEMPETHQNSWNLDMKMSVSFAQTVNGHNLSGSVVDCGYQGGNYWGLDITSIPYNSSGGIFTGGDFLPLVIQTYPVLFSAEGLLVNNVWSVVVDNQMTVSSDQNTITMKLSNGTHGYRILKPDAFYASPSTGVILIHGQAISQVISFSPVLYTLTVQESGIPDTMIWQVSLGGHSDSTTGKSMKFHLANGTYALSVSGPDGYSVSCGNYVLIYGSDAVENITFEYNLHKLNFIVNGLPSNNHWNLEISGINYTSSSNLSLNLPDGMYEYAITPPDNFVATPPEGTVLLLNGNSTVNVDIAVKTYHIIFSTSGLASGTQWSVTIDGSTLISESELLALDLPGGNYSFNIAKVQGYTSSITTGTLQIPGNATGIVVEFTKNPEFTGTAMVISIGVAIGLCASLAVTSIRFRRK